MSAAGVPTGTARGLTPGVTVAGSGLAELTCARLLAGHGHLVRLAPAAPDAGPRPLLLTAPTLDLLRSLWGDGLVDDAPRLTHRRVRWGAHAPAARFAQPAWVVDGAVLARRMRARLGPLPGPDGPTRWTVTARAEAEPVDAVQPAGPVQLPQAGRRHLLAGTTALRPGEDAATAVLDTTELGWLQLTPLGAGDCLVQAMVPGPARDPAALLGRIIADSPLGAALRRPPRSAASVAAAPRLHPAPALAPTERQPHGRLTVGAGAIRFDPLSGTGTAQALRTAILASAVVDAETAGIPAPPLCAHYTRRLRAAYAEHLRSCAALYGTAFTGPAWQDELDAARRA
ncbi:hypothetical protein ACFP3U_06555 [Kitasatospora misakiensis]|uniref:Uncharacterized protein n=1 Tax=Kitasatospora misakiensis TaxID=67330 RepID=A0ABW0X0Z5_9ACTN